MNNHNPFALESIARLDSQPLSLQEHKTALLLRHAGSPISGSNSSLATAQKLVGVLQRNNLLTPPARKSPVFSSDLVRTTMIDALASSLVRRASSMNDLGSLSSSIFGRENYHSTSSATALGILAHTALEQPSIHDSLKLLNCTEQRTVRRLREEDLQNRARETMMLKPKKKQKREEAKDTCQDKPPTKKQKTSTNTPTLRRRGFPLPSLGEGGKNVQKSPLRSYQVLWEKLGGYDEKERFMRRVENGKVPIVKSSLQTSTTKAQ